jgi:hypothetical protein
MQPDDLLNQILVTSTCKWVAGNKVAEVGSLDFAVDNNYSFDTYVGSPFHTKNFFILPSIYIGKLSAINLQSLSRKFPKIFRKKIRGVFK